VACKEGKSFGLYLFSLFLLSFRSLRYSPRLFFQYYLWIISSSLLFCKTKKEKKRRGEYRRERKERRNNEKRDRPKDFPSLQATTMLRGYANRENHITQYSQTMMSELMPHGYENMFFAFPSMIVFHHRTKFYPGDRQRNPKQLDGISFPVRHLHRRHDYNMLR